MTVSAEQFAAILSGKGPKLSVSALFRAFEQCREKYGINTPLREEHFLAQTMMECTYFTKMEEPMSYSTPERLVAVWPSRFSLDPNHSIKLNAREYLRSPEKLGNTVYANRYGNGAFESGDGYRYRGRGAAHLTFKDNYAAASQRIYGDDRLVRKPELVATDAEAAMLTAGDYWNSRHINIKADKDDIRAVTAAINGASGNTLTRVVQERQPYYTRVRSILRK